jgi:FAD/FMN-containing dehydrogenase/Fe-S oxidoreductase
MMEPQTLFDLRGMLPPDTAHKSDHTYMPNLITREQYENQFKEKLKTSLTPELMEYIDEKVRKTFELRHTLKILKDDIEAIVGKGNFSSLWLDREAFSTDSMEHRALITEAVINVYSATALQALVSLLYKNSVPMIPYGEGGGYNMGVTPMAPAVTVSLRGIDHISEIRPSRMDATRFEISVGAGVPFKDLQAYLTKRGFVLRCDPNTPRAATGGIAGTGSNAGRKAWEVIVQGRAVLAEGIAACFAPDAAEQSDILNEPFLMARKFFSVRDPAKIVQAVGDLKKLKQKACISPSAQRLHVPLIGMKASANMAAQKAQFLGSALDTMEVGPVLPISCFVGAEGCTGFIYEVTFEIERPQHYLQACRWHFSNTAAAMEATQAIKKLPRNQQPIFFEIITGQSIQKFLIQDFPHIFSPQDAAVLFIAGEADSKEQAVALVENYTKLAKQSLIAKGTLGHLIKEEATPAINTLTEMELFEHFKKPREELPKKLRTKCKTDMEIRTEYLPAIVEMIAQARPKKMADQKIDVLFGHLTPAHTAIMHWNIGGFDLYDEEQAQIAWDYLEDVINRAQDLAPPSDLFGSARFTGEHGVAGKAPFLWLNAIPSDDFKRMCAVKDALDPKDLFNPETLFLRTSIARSLRARLIAFGDKALRNVQMNLTEKYIMEEALRCTRCNSCKICPVIDAEHELEQEGKRNSKSSVLPSKRNILMFLEKMVAVKKEAEMNGSRSSLQALHKATQEMFKESAELLKKCFYCRKCDKACPVNIDIHPLVRAYHNMADLRPQGSKLWSFLYERLMGEDRFKALSYKLIALGTIMGEPIFKILRAAAFLPSWIKTYFSPPTLVLNHYEPIKNGHKLNALQNYVVVKDCEVLEKSHEDVGFENEVFIRYRGCMDTFGNPNATTSVDSYFKNVLGVAIVDLEKKLCCGFPFEAEGLHERAVKSQLISLVEIAKCIASIRSNEKTATAKITVFSSCPTCCEALREMAGLLQDSEKFAWVLSKSGLQSDFKRESLTFSVKDTAEIAVQILEKKQLLALDAFGPSRAKLTKTVGLKVPCHNTPAATQTQLKLLGMHYESVQSYDRCCGLSGTGRLKHPKIGTKISEKLFEQIMEVPPLVVVSGCPSCRDGVKIQRNILLGEGHKEANFAISGIFEQIVKDFGTGSALKNS